jgi:hypothetical protein
MPVTNEMKTIAVCGIDLFLIGARIGHEAVPRTAIC